MAEDRIAEDAPQEKPQAGNLVEIAAVPAIAGEAEETAARATEQELTPAGPPSVDPKEEAPAPVEPPPAATAAVETEDEGEAPAPEAEEEAAAPAEPPAATIAAVEAEDEGEAPAPEAEEEAPAPAEPPAATIAAVDAEEEEEAPAPEAEEEAPAPAEPPAAATAAVEAEDEGEAPAPTAPPAAATSAVVAEDEEPAEPVAAAPGSQAEKAEAPGELPAIAVLGHTTAGAGPASPELVSAPAEGAAEGAVPAGQPHDAGLDLERKKRRRLLLTLGALVLLLIGAGTIFVRYLTRPGPLPELLPVPIKVNYQPHYLFSIYGVDLPMGVAVSPDDERIYVTETGGARAVRVVDREGTLLDSFAPPQTKPAERAPVYVAVDPAGRVFVSDRMQEAIFVFDATGRLLDAILAPDLTLTEYLSQQLGGLQPDGTLAYNGFSGTVLYKSAGQHQQTLPAPDAPGWAPLGVRLGAGGTMLVTNVAEGQHLVREFPGDLILAAAWTEFDPPEIVFGSQGQGQEELFFPNTAVADSQGRIYVTDGNNGRISVWDPLGTFLFTFGRGVGAGALSLPRGAAIDRRDRLHIVDAVQQAVKVYDVSGPEPKFLYAFGDWGTGDGQFNFPGDIALDSTGRLYIADRKNNRIQVWSY